MWQKNSDGNYVLTPKVFGVCVAVLMGSVVMALLMTYQSCRLVTALRCQRQRPIEVIVRSERQMRGCEGPADECRKAEMFRKEREGSMREFKHGVDEMRRMHGEMDFHRDDMPPMENPGDMPHEDMPPMPPEGRR